MPETFNIIPPPRKLAQEEKALYEASRDLIKFGQMFLPLDFVHKESSPEYHYVIGNKFINSGPGARICNIVYRGGAKSTLMKAAILHKIYFGEQDRPEFAVWLCEAQYQSRNHTSYISHHISYNKQFKRYFGELSGRFVKERFTQTDFITAKGDRVMALGLNQKPRGLIQKDVRITVAALDDFEGEENTKTENSRDYNKGWVASVIFPAMDETSGREGSIWLSGTIVHWDSYLAMMFRNWKKAVEEGRKFSWDVNYIEATSPPGARLEGTPNWPDRFSIKKLKEKQRLFIDSGRPDKFYQEFFHDPRDVSSLPLKVDKVKTYYGDFISQGGFAYLKIKDEYIPIHVFVGVDPAATATTTSDKQAIIILGIDSKTNRYILDRFYARIPIYDMDEKILSLASRYEPIKGGAIETVQSQEFLRDAVARKAVQGNKAWRIGGVKPPPGIKKEDRLLGALGGLINQGKLHIREDQQEIINEIIDFPKGKNDDLLDALYYADYYAKFQAPKSEPISEEEFKKDSPAPKKRLWRKYDWYTGKRL